jgi:hypothetical protein
MQSETQDDALTLMALGILAFILADVTHEALGHGLATLAVGAKPVLLTTCYFSTQGIVSRGIPAAGGLANVCAGLLLLLALRALQPRSPHMRHFLVLCAAFNLFFATAYPFYSGIALFGDWAGVISGLTPAWFWRALLIIVSVAGYYLSLLLVGHAVGPFWRSRESQAMQRLRRITLIPYLAAMAAACLGGIPNPAGWPVIFTAALPAAAASFGLTQMDHFTRSAAPDSAVEPVGTIMRSYAWIAVSGAVLIFFVTVLGPGIHFS